MVFVCGLASERGLQHFGMSAAYDEFETNTHASTDIAVFSVETWVSRPKMSIYCGLSRFATENE